MVDYPFGFDPRMAAFWANRTPDGKPITYSNYDNPNDPNAQNIFGGPYQSGTSAPDPNDPTADPTYTPPPYGANVNMMDQFSPKVSPEQAAYMIASSPSLSQHVVPSPQQPQHSALTQTPAEAAMSRGAQSRNEMLSPDQSFMNWMQNQGFTNPEIIAKSNADTKDQGQTERALENEQLKERLQRERENAKMTLQGSEDAQKKIREDANLEVKRAKMTQDVISKHVDSMIPEYTRLIKGLDKIRVPDPSGKTLYNGAPVMVTVTNPNYEADKAKIWNDLSDKANLLAQSLSVGADGKPTGIVPPQIQKTSQPFLFVDKKLEGLVNSDDKSGILKYTSKNFAASTEYSDYLAHQKKFPDALPPGQKPAIVKPDLAVLQKGHEAMNKQLDQADAQTQKIADNMLQTMQSKHITLQMAQSDPRWNSLPEKVKALIISKSGG